jgi:AcrR family transcriptional regulator
VAEGTIFRVFPDKEALIRAAVQAALDPAPMLDELAGIDIALPLRQRLTEITGILQRRLISVINLLSGAGRPSPPPSVEEHRVNVRPTNEKIHAAVIRMLEPDREQFRCSVSEVARLLGLLTFSGSHSMINEGDPLTPETIVSVLLDGVRHHRPEQS